MLHRWRGMKVGRRVFIGDNVYLDNEYPEFIEIQDDVQISIRAIVVAHTRGPGRVIVEKAAFVGPNCVIVCGAGRTLRIGEGAVVGAGAVITKSVPPRLFISSPSPQPMARVRLPLPLAKTMDEFWAGLVTLNHKSQNPDSPAPREGGPAEDQ